jgi:hypothetical protein
LERVGKLADPRRQLILTDLRSPSLDHPERKGSVAKVG